MQQGCAAHHEGAGERQEFSSSINTHFNMWWWLLLTHSSSSMQSHAICHFLHMRDKAIITMLVVASSGSSLHALASV